MKKLIFALLLGVTTASWAQTLTWSKNIIAPIQGANPVFLNSISKSSASCAVLIDWYINQHEDNEQIASQVMWFGSKGAVLHLEILGPSLPPSSDNLGTSFEIYGISPSRLVLLETTTNEEEGGAIGENIAYLVYSFKKTSKGGIVTKTRYASSSYTTTDNGHADNVGFVTIEKVSGDTWLIKRYIY